MNEDLPTETPSLGDDGSVPDPFDDSGPSARRGRLLGLRRSAAVATALGGLVLGSAVGGFLITRATGPATTVAAATTSTATTSPSPGAHSRGGFGGPNALLGVNLLQDAATTIGISEQTLETDLQGGQTVAQVATANGTTAQAVINALVGDETTAIDNLASSGKITSAQETKLQANVTQMVTSFVNQTRPATAPGAGSGGSGDEHPPEGHIDCLPEILVLVFFESELGHVELKACFVKKAQYDLFAKKGRQNRDPEVHLAPLGP